MSDTSRGAAPAEGEGPIVLSVVLVTPGDFGNLRRTFHHLARQSIRSRIELVLVAPSADSLEDMTARDRAAAAEFGSFLPMFVGRIDDVDVAASRGFRQASAPVIGTIEDHAYPQPRWAEVVARRHAEGPWTVVGATIVNANPGTALSWCNQLMAYGEWTEPVQSGPRSNISRHNMSIKKAALEEFGDELARYVRRAGGLLPRLRAGGHRFFLDAEARVGHANPSRLASTVQLRFLAGRLNAASRVSREGWSTLRRVVYVLGCPLIPLVRFAKLRDKLFARERARRLPTLFPAFALVLALDALGQAVGFAAGPGRAQERLATFEFDRMRHLTRYDRRELAKG